MRFRTPGPLALGLLLWIGLEFAAFGFVLGRFGIGGALLIGVASLVLGVVALQRLGRSALTGLKTAMERGEPGESALMEGTLAALGGLLLILPGFVSDGIGLILLLGPVRKAIARRFGGVGEAGPRRPAPDGVIDLDPAEWSAAEQERQGKPEQGEAERFPPRRLP